MTRSNQSRFQKSKKANKKTPLHTTVGKRKLPRPPEDLNHGIPLANSAKLWKRGLDWPIVLWIGFVHGIALFAFIPSLFTWQALVACVGLCWLTASIGVCMGYHRLLTHRSFRTYKIVRWMLAFCGGLSGEGSALTWVANHRKHHIYSDQLGDPHSPHDDSVWSHMLWFMPNFGRKWHGDLLQRYAPDLMKDRMMLFIHKMFLPSHIGLGVMLFVVGYQGTWIGLAGGWTTAFSMLVWGLGVRMVYVLHVTWMINSVTHIWGYRNYETTDDSKNLWWVSLLAFGEGWHNNHHAYQRVCSQGHRWWEIDMTYWCVLLMEKMGLAWDIVRLKDIPKGTPPA